MICLGSYPAHSSTPCNSGGKLEAGFSLEDNWLKVNFMVDLL